MKKIKKKKRPWEPMGDNIKADALNVVSMVIRLLTQNTLKMKKKAKRRERETYM